MSKRIYIIVQSNFRHLDGSSIEGIDETQTIVENDEFTWKGQGWWQDNGDHMPGSGFFSEHENNVEAEIETAEGLINGYMDQTAYSFDAKDLPIQKENSLRETKDAGEIIFEISDALGQLDGEFIAMIANQILTEDVEYKGDSLFLTKMPLA